MIIVAALAPFADILFALLMVVLGIIVSAVIVPPLVFALRQLPLLGGQLADAVQRFGDDLQRTVNQNLDRAVQVVTDAVDMISGRVQQWISDVTDFLDFAATQLGRLAQGFPLLAKMATDGINQLMHTTADIVGKVAHALSVAVTTAATLAGALAHTIPNAIDQAVANVRTWINGRVEDVRKAILSVVAALEAGLLDALGQERLARKAADATMAGHIDAGLADLGRGIDADLGRLADQIGRAIDGLETDLGNITKLIGVVSAGTIVGMITEVVTEIDTLRRECIDPMCSYLTPRLDMLNGLADAASAAVILGLVAEAVRDPEGAARTAEGLVRPMMGFVDDAFRTVAGIGVAL